MMLLLVLLLIVTSVVSEDFCGIDLFPQRGNEPQLMFSKELSTVEYAAVGNFVSLHCCATYFRTIEWFKDGEPYPWRPSDESSLIINPASHNQTIYTQRLHTVDFGNYSCLVSNASHVIRHHVTLTTTGAVTPVGSPKETYKPKDLYRQIGASARFYCEAYVGNINLPDAKSEIVWSRHTANHTAFPLSPRLVQRKIHRGNERIVGAFLILEEIEEEDFGQYWCEVSNDGDQSLQLSATLFQVVPAEDVVEGDISRESVSRWGWFWLSMGAVTVTISFFMAVRFRLKIRIMWKHVWNHFHSPGESEVDIAVMFHVRDAPLALSQIVPTLRNRFHYICSVTQYQALPSADSGAVSSRRLLAIVTPPSTGGTWNSRSISQHLVNLLALHPKVICLFFKELPMNESKTEDGRRLKDSLAKVHYITHNETQGSNFWTLVQLGLPVLQRRPRPVQHRDSLENLM